MISYVLIGLLIIGVGALAFWRLNPFIAFAATFALPPVLFQLINWAYSGYLDPFWKFATFVTFVISLFGSLIVGLFAWMIRSYLLNANGHSEI